MPQVVVPVGLMFGPSYTEDSPDAPEHFVVGRASGPRNLDLPRWKTWLLAHGERNPAVDLETTREALITKAAENGVSDAESVVSSLLADGDLVEFDTAYGKQREFFSSYRLKPLAFGYGNDPAERAVSWIGRPGDEQALKIPAEVRSIWEKGLTCTNIWGRVEFLAARRRRRRSEAYPADPDWIAEVVASFLPLVIAVGGAFLDDDEDITLEG
jgi:hypothetical protein